MKWVRRLSLFSIMLLVPGIMIAGAFNLVVRMPDFYQFEFNRTDIGQELSLPVTQGELSEALSDYMWGRKSELVLEYENENTEQTENLFLPEEQTLMEEKRSKLNLYSLGMAVAVVALSAAYFVLLRGQFKSELRKAFLLSLPFGVLYSGIAAGGLFLKGLPAAFESLFLKPGFPTDSVLAAVFTEQFVREIAVASVAVAAVGYLVLGMVTWSLTKPYHMFRREQHGRMN